MKEQNFDYSTLFEDYAEDINPHGLGLDSPRMRSAAITLNLMAKERKAIQRSKWNGEFMYASHCRAIWHDLYKDIRIINRKRLYEQNRYRFL